MQELEAFFGRPLAPDPRFALAGSVSAPAVKTGPIPRIEFTIEFVGPYSVAASAAGRLVDPDWYGALGQPQAWAMRPSDTRWEPLTGDRNGSYDSLALSWPIVRPDGYLSDRAATLLEQSAAHFAHAINRKIVSLPHIQDLNGLGSDLARALDELDIGFCLTFLPSQGTVSEAAIWEQSAAHGLQFSPQSAFVWHPKGAAFPLFEVLPFGQFERFSLANVKSGVRHEGVTIGFSVPTCPNPERAIEGALRFGRNLCENLGGRILDDSDRFVDKAAAESIIRECQHAVSLLNQAKLTPGSAEAVRLFSSVQAL
jgi:hypothetical protein